jgi:hypothetical protein
VRGVVGRSRLDSTAGGLTFMVAAMPTATEDRRRRRWRRVWRVLRAIMVFGAALGPAAPPPPDPPAPEEQEDDDGQLDESL